MVGRLSLQDVPELVDTKKKGDGVLDSPDSGLPPSPSPSHWGLAAAGGSAGGGGERAPPPGALEPYAAATPAAPNPALLPNALSAGCSPRLCPLSFGEGVEFDPLPPKEVRYTSSVKYDSERHFIDDVQLPLGLSVTSCSQTVICIPDCTWRSYKAEVRFEPRHKPARFLSTTIVYPKYPKTVYTTTLDYNCHKKRRRFLSSVELEATECLGSDGLSDEC
ncbi:refilin-B isoform X2 [Cavia porcellus]|uniref:refilin-B isoform X2 n=1 Tax=Cavia porcellus TaxID=10141 RepID=UPI002FDFFFEF